MQKLLFFLFLIPLFLCAQEKVGVLDSLNITEKGIPLEQVRYFHDVSVHSVYDGDTPTLKIELGFSTIRIEAFRLAGINTPEIRPLSTRPQGEASRDHLIKLMNQADHLMIQTFPEKKGSYADDKEKYGRYLGVLYGIFGDWLISLNDRMVLDGFAVYKVY